MQIALSDIAEVREIISPNYLAKPGTEATDEVNKFLNRGWVLLNIYTTCRDPQATPQHQAIHYVLGIDKGTKQANEDWDNGLISGPPQNE